MKYSNMASTANLWSAIQTSKTRKKGNDEDLYFAEEMYESGMRYVIEEMASQRYREQPYDTKKDLSEERQEAVSKAAAIAGQLRSMLTEEQYALVRELEDELCSDQSYAEEEQYIKGFYEGYKYVKELQ